MTPFSPDLIPLSAVCDLLTSRPGLPTVRNWGKVGVHGVRLEVVKIGGRYFTTRQAVAEFTTTLSHFDALAAEEVADLAAEEVAEVAAR